MPASLSSCTSSTRSFSSPSPAAITYTIVALLRMPFATHFGQTMAKTRSSPMLTPTHGSPAVFFPSPAAAAVNIPTRLSYRPPAAIDPTPTEDSSISSSSSSAGAEDFFEGFFLVGAGAGVGADAEVSPVEDAEDVDAKALADLKPGGADASTMAS